jgi:hypothetical protein
MNKDQKNLERLYEQITNTPFILLDEEKEYFDKIAKILSNLIVYKQDQLKKYAINFKKLKTLSNFDQMLWAENIPWIFDKIDTSEQEEGINETYHDMITYHVMDKIEVSCKLLKDTPLIVFNDNNDTAIDKVEITNKQKLKEALIAAFIRALEKWDKQFEAFKRTESYVLWHEWRTNRLKIQSVRNRLPELQGMF